MYCNESCELSNDDFEFLLLSIGTDKSVMHILQVMHLLTEVLFDSKEIN